MYIGVMVCAMCVMAYRCDGEVCGCDGVLGNPLDSFLLCADVFFIWLGEALGEVGELDSWKAEGFCLYSSFYVHAGHGGFSPRVYTAEGMHTGSHHHLNTHCVHTHA